MGYIITLTVGFILLFSGLYSVYKKDKVARWNSEVYSKWAHFIGRNLWIGVVVMSLFAALGVVDLIGAVIFYTDPERLNEVPCWSFLVPKTFRDNGLYMVISGFIMLTVGIIGILDYKHISDGHVKFYGGIAKFFEKESRSAVFQGVVFIAARVSLITLCFMCLLFY
jgi:hypothetical protein